MKSHKIYVCLILYLCICFFFSGKNEFSRMNFKCRPLTITSSPCLSVWSSSALSEGKENIKIKIITYIPILKKCPFKAKPLCQQSKNGSLSLTALAQELYVEL